MTPDIENHQNLLSLWHLYGAVPLDPQSNVIWRNTDWPHRCWLEQPESLEELLSDKQSRMSLQEILASAPAETIFSIFHSEALSNASANEAFINHMAKAGRQRSSNQLAMYLPLASWHCPKPDIQLAMKRITDADEFDKWAAIGSDAFGYKINPKIITGLSDKNGIRCFLVDYQEEPVATALMYQTGSTMGIHQVAVKSSHQGQGIARNLMTALIGHCKNMGLDSVVLQASDAGKPLYDSLGFRDLYEIHNFQHR